MVRGFRSTPRGGMGQVELLTLTYQSVATAGGCLSVESDFLLSALKKEEYKKRDLESDFLDIYFDNKNQGYRICKGILIPMRRKRTKKKRGSTWASDLLC